MAKREGEPIVKSTVPAPHPLAELIAQMLTGVAHVPRVEQARMVADAAKAAAKWHDARVAELEAERDRLREAIGEVGDILDNNHVANGCCDLCDNEDGHEDWCIIAKLAAALAAKEVGRG